METLKVAPASVVREPPASGALAATLATAFIGTIGYSSFLGLPIMLGVLAEARQFNELAIGWIGSAEMAGLLIGSVFAAFFLPRLSATGLLLVGIGAATAANLATLYFSDAYGVAIMRLLVGVGGGVCYSVATARLATIGDATRNFSLLTMLMAAQTGVLLVALPWLASLFGPFSVMLLLAGFLCVAGVLIPFVPAAMEAAEPMFTARQAGTTSALNIGYVCLGCAMLFGIAAGGSWAFIERIGTINGVSIATVGSLLSIANLANIGSCWIAARADRYIPAKWVMALALAPCALIFATWPVGGGGVFDYAIRTFLLFQFLAFTQIYLLALFGRTDQSGRQAALAPAAIGAGLAIGPLLTASLIAFDGYHAALLLDAALVIVLLTIIWWIYHRLDMMDERPTT